MVYKYKFNPIPILFCELYSEMSIFSDKIESRQKLSNDFYLSVGIDIYILLLFLYICENIQTFVPIL